MCDSQSVAIPLQRDITFKKMNLRVIGLLIRVLKVNRTPKERARNPTHPRRNVGIREAE